jgi:hypothetical protein
MALEISTIKVENMTTDEEKVLQTTSVQISDSAYVTEGSNINVNNPLLDESNKITTCIKVEQLNIEEALQFQQSDEPAKTTFLKDEIATLTSNGLSSGPERNSKGDLSSTSTGMFNVMVKKEPVEDLSSAPSSGPMLRIVDLGMNKLGVAFVCPTNRTINTKNLVTGQMSAVGAFSNDATNTNVMLKDNRIISHDVPSSIVTQAPINCHDTCTTIINDKVVGRNENVIYDQQDEDISKIPRKKPYVNKMCPQFKPWQDQDEKGLDSGSFSLNENNDVQKLVPVEHSLKDPDSTSKSKVNIFSKIPRNKPYVNKMYQQLKEWEDQDKEKRGAEPSFSKKTNHVPKLVPIKQLIYRPNAICTSKAKVKLTPSVTSTWSVCDLQGESYIIPGECTLSIGVVSKKINNKPVSCETQRWSLSRSVNTKSVASFLKEKEERPFKSASTTSKITEPYLTRLCDIPTPKKKISNESSAYPVIECFPSKPYERLSNKIFTKVLVPSLTKVAIKNCVDPSRSRSTKSTEPYPVALFSSSISQPLTKSVQQHVSESNACIGNSSSDDLKDKDFNDLAKCNVKLVSVNQNERLIDIQKHDFRSENLNTCNLDDTCMSAESIKYSVKMEINQSESTTEVSSDTDIVNSSRLCQLITGEDQNDMFHKSTPGKL